MTLAYVFWHAPADGVEQGAYEERLRAFHRALAGAPPPGLRAAAALALETPPPWLGWPGRVYEDWYLLDGWPAVGELEQAALDARRREPHDAVAGAAAQGSGAIYALRGGPAAAPAGGPSLWLAKPPGTTIAALAGALAAGEGASLWQRCLALGPAPEICLRDPHGRLRDAADAVRTQAHLVTEP
jgi:hypothetical protein